MTKAPSFIRNAALAIGAVAMSMGMIAPLNAQSVESFDPDVIYTDEIDGDLDPAGQTPPSDTQESLDQASEDIGQSDPFAEAMVTYSETPEDAAAAQAEGDLAAAESATEPLAQASTTYGEDDLIGAAQGVFGEGAEGLARIIQKALADQGEPNAYIVGREAGGAFVFGARYGSGTLHHKIEGERKVYWTGPSIGFDAGANAGSTFVLVYNLFDTEDIFKRFPAGEGQAYLVGGLHASYMRRGDTVLIPIRVGAGLRLGVNAGYMKFSDKQRWLPF